MAEERRRMEFVQKNVAEYQGHFTYLEDSFKVSKYVSFWTFWRFDGPRFEECPHYSFIFITKSCFLSLLVTISLL